MTTIRTFEGNAFYLYLNEDAQRFITNEYPIDPSTIELCDWEEIEDMKSFMQELSKDANWKEIL